MKYRNRQIKLKEQLECAIEQKKSITIREIAETTGIEEGVIDNRIASDENPYNA